MCDILGGKPKPDQAILNNQSSERVSNKPSLQRNSLAPPIRKDFSDVAVPNHRNSGGPNSRLNKFRTLQKECKLKITIENSFQEPFKQF